MPGDSKCPFWDGDLWPFQRSSDLQPRDDKVTLNHLVYIHIFYRIPWEYILPTWMVDFNGNITVVNMSFPRILWDMKNILNLRHLGTFSLKCS